MDLISILSRLSISVFVRSIKDKNPLPGLLYIEYITKAT